MPLKQSVSIADSYNMSKEGAPKGFRPGMIAVSVGFGDVEFLDCGPSRPEANRQTRLAAHMRDNFKRDYCVVYTHHQGVVGLQTPTKAFEGQSYYANESILDALLLSFASRKIEYCETFWDYYKKKRPNSTGNRMTPGATSPYYGKMAITTIYLRSGMDRDIPSITEVAKELGLDASRNYKQPESSLINHMLDYERQLPEGGVRLFSDGDFKSAVSELLETYFKPED